MNQQNDILKELQELSITIAGIARVNVFTIPQGYFEALSEHILMQVRAVDNTAITPIKGANVPEGYFSGLADTILNRIKKETLAEVANETKDNSELLAGIGNKNIYSVPEGYFEKLADTILSQTKYKLLSDAAQETNTVSQLVAGIGNKNIYSVPQGYFDGLTEQVNLKTSAQPKVVSIKSRFTIFRYAAAAVLTGLIGFSIFFMLNKTAITANTKIDLAITEANQIIKTNSFDKEMESISDAAIVQFLESKGQNVEAALVASLEDEKKLPDADEYLINENTLDNVLKTLDPNN